MSQKKYFSYIRVSTQRQGQHGTSLVEQQAAIDAFARYNDLRIVERFSELETAAKRGRPVFLSMLKQLKVREADGVVIHKIDRSARNLRDWADLGALIDNGVEVHFASESLDLTSRGGRLSADIQAVVAADFIRNLREESRKGIHGRLKQGLFPFPAPLGYLDRGKGNPKEIDPVAGPLIRRAFELYATGNWSLISLPRKLDEIGLRSRSGKTLSTNGVFKLLHNPFYCGFVRVGKLGEAYVGQHRPIVSKVLFDEVQRKLTGRNIPKVVSHEFAFRRMVSCGNCSKMLIGELQKGRVYYRCHTRHCDFTSVREDRVEHAVARELHRLKIEPEEFEWIQEVAKGLFGEWKSESEDVRASLLQRLRAIKDRQSKLIDFYMDGVLEKEEFLARKELLIKEELALKQPLDDGQDWSDLVSKFDRFLELANSAEISLISAPYAEKREVLEILTSNLTAKGKSLLVKLNSPFDLLCSRPSFYSGRARANTARTVSAWIRQILFEAFPKGQFKLLKNRTDTTLGV